MEMATWIVNFLLPITLFTLTCLGMFFYALGLVSSSLLDENLEEAVMEEEITKDSEIFELIRTNHKLSVENLQRQEQVQTLNIIELINTNYALKRQQLNIGKFCCTFKTPVTLVGV